MRADRTRLPDVTGDPVFAFPRIVRDRLANGLNLHTIEHRDMPVITFVVQVKDGSGADPQGQDGLVGLAADMLDEGTTRRLVRNYGSAWSDVLRYLPTPERADRRMADSRSILTAEIRHAVHEEMAVSLGDVVFRRTDLGTAGHPGEEVLRLSAAIMGQEMGWTTARTKQELDGVERTFVQKHSTVRGHGPTVAGAAVQ